MGLFPPLRPNFDAALRDVHSERVAAREAAAEALGHADVEQRERAVEALRPLVDDPTGSVRAQAMTSLARLGARSALDLIIARFEDQDPTVSQVALISAGEIGDVKARSAVEAALESPRPEVRFQAIATWVTLSPEGSPAPMLRLVDDADPEVRAQLADALGALEDPVGTSALAQLLDDPEVEVRVAAAVALASLGDARGVEVLIEGLEGEARFFEAAWALGELGAETAREPLARAAMAWRRPLALRASAAAALVRLGDSRGVATLRQVLRAFRWDARSYAVELVGELRALELVGEVVRLARNPRGADLVVVARTLAQLAPESGEARQALKRLAAGTGEAGEVAAAALGHE